MMKPVVPSSDVYVSRMPRCIGERVSCVALLICALAVSACSDRGLVQMREGRPLGDPAQERFQDYWDLVASTTGVSVPAYEPLDREALMSSVLGIWRPDASLTTTVFDENVFYDIRPDGTVYGADEQRLGTWDMRNGRIDLWRDAQYQSSFVRIQGRLCRLTPTEDRGYVVLQRSSPE